MLKATCPWISSTQEAPTSTQAILPSCHSPALAAVATPLSNALACPAAPHLCLPVLPLYLCLLLRQLRLELLRRRTAALGAAAVARRAPGLRRLRRTGGLLTPQTRTQPLHLSGYGTAQSRV